MTDMAAELAAMLAGLERKEKALAEILAITENQQVAIKSSLPFSEARALIFDMNAEKQGAIKAVKDCDSMFEETLGRIGPELERTQHLHKELVGAMQALIRRIMDADSRIRRTEAENNELLDLKRDGGPAPESETKPETGAGTGAAAGPAKKPAGGRLGQKMSMPVSHKHVVDAYKQGRRDFRG